MQRYSLHFLFCFLFLCFYSDPAESQGVYNLEEIPSAVERLNEKSPQSEYMRNAMTYNAFRYKDPKLPSWITIYRWYKAKYGNTKGLYDFIFPDRHTISTLYALEAVPLAVADLNAKLPAEEQIKDVETYNQFRHRDLKLPSWTSLVNWFTEVYGEGEGLLSFVLSSKEPYFRFYDLDEIPSKVTNLNARSPEKEQMRSIATYEEFRFKDPKLPSWGTIVNWFKEKYGDGRGASNFIFEGSLNFQLYNLEEVPSAVAEINTESSEKEQMKSRKTYEKFRYKDRRLPAWSTLKRWYKAEYGDTKGLSDLIFGKGCADTFSRS
ncbi:MAG: hypothetical protein OXK80_06235 [Bdellovibrionales bacterium]|nr:hypothetical protein [Bdellovibrionales bacterium]